jgi:hypothetical protein
MSRSKNLLLRAPLIVLPLIFACSSSGSKPAASADDADKTEESASADASGDAEDMAKADDDEEAKSEDKKADKKATKKAAADEEDDDGEAAPKDDSRTTGACDKVIMDNRKAYNKCYKEGGKNSSDLKGTIKLVVDIDSAGKVTKAAIDDESTIKEPKVYECMIALTKTLTFPASTKGLEKQFSHEFIHNMGTQ